MALIKCPDCGKEISDSAPACPNCGRPIAIKTQSQINEHTKIKVVPDGYKIASNPNKGMPSIGLGVLGMTISLIYLLNIIIDYSISIINPSAFILPIIMLVVSLVFLFSGYFNQNKMIYYECPNCGYFGKKTKTIVKGSGCLEIFLWLFFIIPGIIYTIYRSSSVEKKACPKCEYSHLKQWKLEIK